MPRIFVFLMLVLSQYLDYISRRGPRVHSLCCLSICLLTISCITVHTPSSALKEGNSWLYENMDGPEKNYGSEKLVTEGQDYDSTGYETSKIVKLTELSRRN